MKDRPQWVCWSLEGSQKSKAPVSPLTGQPASVDRPETWTDYSMAVDFAKENGCGGVGFVFTADDPYCGIDLDGCRDPRTGEIDPWAKDLIERLDSYAEISPSGEGVHVLVKAVLPPGRRRTGNIEMYDSGRFFTVTGRHVEGTPREIRHRQEEIEALHGEIFGSHRENGDHRADNRATGLTDEEIIAKAKNAKNGERFSRLWSGDATGYPSDSEADAALCSPLAFFCGPDEARIDRLFRSSGLCRDKWLERPDYRRRTIEMVLERSEFYGPKTEVAPRAGSQGPVTKQWPVLADEAFHGLAGDVARAIEPHTEADPVALLVSILVAFGNMVGRGAHFAVGATRHHLKLYVALVGMTSKARKGTSWDPSGI